MKNAHIDIPIFFTPPCNQPDKRRRLFGGGGGGGDGGAAARKQEEDARVAAAIRSINQSFGVDGGGKDEAPSGGGFGRWAKAPGMLGMAGRFFQMGQQPAQPGQRGQAARDTMAQREALYKSFSDDAQAVAKQDLDLDRATFQRDSDFSMARSGLAGGSRQIDLGRDILDTYNRGILKSAEAGTRVATDARSADDRTRVNLINSVRQGLDEGSAQQQAIEGMANASRQARDTARATSFEGFFDRLASIQQDHNYAAGGDRYAEEKQRRAGPKYGTDAGTVRGVK